MRIEFPYPGYEQIASAQVPDANLLGVYEPRSLGEVDEGNILARGFDEPYGASRLRDVVQPTDRLLILIEDGTRGTPVPRLLKRVVEHLVRKFDEETGLALIDLDATGNE